MESILQASELGGMLLLGAGLGALDGARARRTGPADAVQVFFLAAALDVLASFVFAGGVDPPRIAVSAAVFALAPYLAARSLRGRHGSRPVQRPASGSPEGIA